MTSSCQDPTEFLDDDDDERDEIKEIEQGSQNETNRVRFWRVVVTLFLTVTGIAVAGSSYLALLRQETRNFEDAYAQFSRTVGQAAVEEILRLREAVRTFAGTVTSTAKLANATWPFYDFPGLQAFAQEQVDAKQMESIGYLTRVSHEQREAYLQFQGDIHERWVKAGHMRAYGNLDVLFQGAYQNDILEFTPEGLLPSSDKPEYYPLAYRYPPPNSYFVINFDIHSINYDDLFDSMHLLKNQSLLSNVNPFIEGDEAEKKFHARFHDQLPDSDASFPHSFLFHPVHKEVEDYESEIVAVVTFPLAWDASLRRLLPDQVQGIVAVARNNCGQAVTYEIVGQNAFFIGWEDMHDPRYDNKEYVVNLDFSDHSQFLHTPGHCAYSLSIYPSERFEQAYQSRTPMIYVILISCTFTLMIVVFFVYDWVVQRRNSKLIRDAARSNEIVTSMFPGQLRDKIMAQKQTQGGTNSTWNKKSKQLTSMLQRGDTQMLEIDEGEPLAELHTETTLMFADVVGFTAWSSSREPSHVFHLLETIYRSFDVLARQRVIFKVETVGDCYVAVSGFPEKQRDHASRMCRFAVQCLKNFSRAVKALEDSLGADTGALGLRVGIHSGQVTAGVLRGDRTRFQLFGDAMNTTSRIETTGKGGQIHVSEDTAKLLEKDGLGSWVVEREDSVHAKGKGEIRTFWLTSNNKVSLAPSTATAGTSEKSCSSNEQEENTTTSEHSKRLMAWNVSVLLNLLKKIIAQRERSDVATSNENPGEIASLEKKLMDTTRCFIEEVKDPVCLRDFDASSMNHESTSGIDPHVEGQLRHFVSCVAAMYRSNPFHNFELASYAAMSTLKLFSNIGAQQGSAQGIWGVLNDPLTQFACIFSAMIHDIGHTGVPNTRLIEENPTLGQRYKGASVAEQNSLDLTWGLLMDDSFKKLRQAIYSTPQELQQFRGLLVQTVMSTDITNTELKTWRNNRWNEAFAKCSGNACENESDMMNRKVAVLIEHLSEASDIFPAMQDWHVYLRWNKRLFQEKHKAWKTGRANATPAEFWSQDEIDFFDFVAIPLARKINECGAFGSFGDEYLKNALTNRSEWQEKGDSIVAEMANEMSSI